MFSCTAKQKAKTTFSYSCTFFYTHKGLFKIISSGMCRKCPFRQSLSDTRVFFIRLLIFTSDLF